MSLRPPSAASVVAQIRDLLGLRSEESRAALPAQVVERLQRLTHERLLDWAARLGLTDLGQLTKDAVAARIQGALRTVGAVLRETPAPPPLAARKYDLRRQDAEPEPPADIPWGYGQDRVTAMVVDPDRLFVYWEVTDEAIARARDGLGGGGRDAWLSLRVYDVTGRIFDGTNAHSYLDQRVERGDRQWFFEIGKPTSTACVELGLKSYEGYFVRVARSGRADFPPQEPGAPGEVEWLTVRVATGDTTPPAMASSPPIQTPPEPTVDVRETHADAGGEWVERRVEWEDGSRYEWEETAAHSRWEAGPFPTSVEPPSRTVEEWHGTQTSVRTENGRMHVVFGPWQVVIRGLAGYAMRQVIAVWELTRSWRAGESAEPLLVALGSGASEHAGASELRLGGASELYRLGGSELRLRGASELRLGGASEAMYRGASERRWGGASEDRSRGASEPLRR